ncbi:TetR family transcriptional regulator [Subtercola endophyticus]|uniref:TetR family transcriptional regulator n=1 Tax=Subtercola endophyticus TaxID=2895559 RepID=UPI001E56B2ED|nr:TetR/AcrR family transcriptional regulator C-terminal domain-containing protein [Subtercola endophyticus]UFS58079.1 TetR/AcrR family transcriptional regulator C-terminal domain-containing protein [Subtercola endophyticus]
MTTVHGSPAKNGRHSRDDVAKAALRILDEYGLPDLTMRRLAAELDVQPSALYWHFPNKQTLLAELADRIASRGRTDVSPSAEWMSVTSAEAASLRDALLAYRDGAEVVSSTLALGLGESVPLSRLTSAVRLGGFDDETARRASTALLHFILGHVSHEQQRLQYDSIGVAAGNGGTGNATGTLDDAELTAAEGAAEFSFGVQLFIAGLGALAAESALTAIP